MKENKLFTTMNLNSFIKALFGVVTAFPDDPNPVLNFSSSQIDLKCNSRKTSNSIMNRFNSIEAASIGIQTETEIWDTQTDSQLTASLWRTEFAIAEFEQENQHLLIELNNLKVSLKCSIRSRANGKANAGRAESKIEISEKVTSDSFQEKKEVNQHFEEVTSKAESLQSELLEPKKPLFS